MTLLQQQDYLEPLLKYQKKKSFEEEEDTSNETEYSYLRLLPDMSEGLIGLCIGDIMGILLSVDAGNSLTVQQQQELKTFIETLLRTSKSSLSIFKLSIFYLYKLNKKLREYSILKVFKNNLNEKNISSLDSMKQAKILYVVILMLAFKYMEDHCYYISAWSKATGISSDTIHKVEVIFLNLLDHNLFVSQERFESFSSRIIQKINKLKIDLLQSVKISYASSNYSSSSSSSSGEDEEEEESKNISSYNAKHYRNYSNKRKQDTTLKSDNKKRRKRKVGLTISTIESSRDNTNTIRSSESQKDHSSKHTHALPSTLCDYYKNRNEADVMKQQQQLLTPPTPNHFSNNNIINNSNPNNNSNTNTNDNININTNTNTTINNTKTAVNTINSTLQTITKNPLQQMDSMIIPSTPPTSQTSIYEDMDREEEMKKSSRINKKEKNKEREEEYFEEEEEEDDDDDDDDNEVEEEEEEEMWEEVGEGEREVKKEEVESEDEDQLPKSQNAFKSSTMAFILNPDENKIQLDYGKRETRQIQSKTIPYHYHNLSPSHTHHKTNFAYDNLKKVNLLNMKNEKTRITPSIILPNTSSVADVASIFPSLSMLSHQGSSSSSFTPTTTSCDSNPIEDTIINKTKSMGLKSLLSDKTFKSSMDSIIIGNSKDDLQTMSCPTNFINIRHDDTNTFSTNANKSNNVNTGASGSASGSAGTSNNNENNIASTSCSYLNQIYSLSNDDLTKQKLLLSIYNCYAMKNIRHYQI